MKAYLLLLKTNLLSAVAGLRRGSLKKENGRIDVSRIALYAVVLCSFVFLIGMFIYAEYVLYDLMAAFKQERLLIGIVVMLSAVMTLFMGLPQTLATLYFGKDVPAQAHLPISSRTMLAAKWTEVYLSEMLLSTSMLLPLMVMYGLDHGVSAFYVLRCLTLMLASPLYPLGISLLLSAVLGRATTFTRHREAWIAAGTMLMVLLIVSVEMTLLPRIPDDAGGMFFVQLILNSEGLLNLALGAFPPFLWAVHGLEGAAGEWLLYVFVGAALIALLLWLLGPGYVGVCIRHSEQGTGSRRSRIRGDAYRVRSPLAAVYRREMSEAIRTPVYFLNGVLGVLMMVVMMGVSMGTALTQETGAGEVTEVIQELLAMLSPVDLTLIIAGVLSLMCWVCPLPSTAISREGKRLQVTRMIPVPAMTILNAKLLVSMTVIGAAAVLVCALLVILLGAAYLPHVLAALVMVNLLSYAVSAANIIVDTVKPRLDWKNETEAMKQNFNQMLGMVVTTVMLALLIAGPVLLAVYTQTGPMVRLATVLGVLGLECAVSALLMRLYAAPRYASLEP